MHKLSMRGLMMTVTISSGVGKSTEKGRNKSKVTHEEVRLAEPGLHPRFAQSFQGNSFSLL
eukprot:996069-Amphidinium_carterae.1